MVKYNLFFVPKLHDRTKISALRSKTCKQVHSTQALQYPVHMSLISGGFEAKNYAALEKELWVFCKDIAPFLLKAETSTAVLPERFWTGIHIKQTRKLQELRQELQKLRNRHATDEEEHRYRPLHITLAYPAIVKGVKPTKCPVTTMVFDRITVVRKESDTAPYRVYKHIPFS